MWMLPIPALGKSSVPGTWHWALAGWIGVHLTFFCLRYLRAIRIGFDRYTTYTAQIQEMEYAKEKKKNPKKSVAWKWCSASMSEAILSRIW
jgi:hypothetical protein